MTNKSDINIFTILLMGFLIILICVTLYLSFSEDDINFNLFNFNTNNNNDYDNYDDDNDNDIEYNESVNNLENDEKSEITTDVKITADVYNNKKNIIEYFNFNNKKTKEKEYFRNKKPVNKRKNYARLEFYSMDNCPHCNNFKSTWTKIKNRGDIITSTMKPSNMNYEKKIDKYGITEFPHIQKVYPNGKVRKYNGKLNYNSIIDWFFS